MEWIVDQSGHSVVDGLEVRHGGTGGSEKKGNAILERGDVVGVTCWEFDVTGGQGMWIGLGTKDNFGPGYGMKGLLYGGPGNLSDGGSLIQGNWGPKFGQGDKIGLRLEVNGDNVIIAFSKNGTGLGVAFDIQGWSDGAGLRPIVSLDSPGQSIKIEEISSALPLEAYSLPTTVPEGISGTWSGTGCQLNIEPESVAGQWRLGVTVANSISCVVTELPGGGFSASEARSTMMMPPPHLEEREEYIKMMMEGLTNITREGEGLKLTAGDKSEMFTWAPGASPATKEMIRWIK